MKRIVKRLQPFVALLSSYTGVHARRLFWDYLRIVIKNRIVARGPGTERLLSFTISYPDRDMFFGVASEIFFRNMYGLKKAPLQPVTHVVDCGANIGLSVLYFAWQYPKAHITCFEPNPEALVYLKKNIEDNHLANVTVLPYALGRENKEVAFYVDADALGSSSASATRGNEVLADERQKVLMVPMRKLSEYVEQPIDILKVDIEGAEGEVFEELEEAGKLDLVRRMFIEYHFDNEHMTFPLGKFLSIFDRAGFVYGIYSSFSFPFSPVFPRMLTYIVHVCKDERVSTHT